MDTPMILSLVYNRGTILASKRSPYDDLIETGFDEMVLAERLQKQHKLMCAAIKAGRIEDLKAMTAKNSAYSPAAAEDGEGKKPKVRKAARKRAPASADTLEVLSPIAKPNIPLGLEAAQVDGVPPIPMPTHISIPTPLVPKHNLISLSRQVSIIEEHSVLPEDAVAVISDQVTENAAPTGRLRIEFIGDSDFKGGENKTVSVKVSRGRDRTGISDVQVMIKILGSSFRPVIFHSMTDDNGLARTHMQFPRFSSGRATIMARALNGGEEVELRRPVYPG